MLKLDWDSKFWKINIYYARPKDDVLNFIEQNNINSNAYLIQSLIDVENKNLINQREKEGFRYVETKINLTKSAGKETVLNNNLFKNIKHHDLGIYVNEFRNMFYKNSRYNMFNSNQVNDYYYTWIVNSIDGKKDDAAIGYYVDDVLCGFLTYKIDEDILIIGLIGVFSQFQRQGIGQKLLNKVTNKAVRKGCSKIEVSTQGQNYNAINAYIKNGFIIKNIQKWYYLRGEIND